MASLSFCQPSWLSSLFLFFLALFSLPCITANHFRALAAQSEWHPAGATWYGSPNGAGSNGGACGYRNAVERPPFSAMISAGGPSLFDAGKGCGTCYQVKCTGNAVCSEKPVTVVITDECPGCVTAFDRYSAHFDLSGTAFGAMAVSGKADQLRRAGRLRVQYRRVPCKYSGVNLALHIDEGSNPYYFAVTVLYVSGDGDLGAVEVGEASDSGRWRPMVRSWGSVWRLDSGQPLRPPFSLRFTSGKSREAVVAREVIPAAWTPGAVYRSSVNF